MAKALWQTLGILAAGYGGKVGLDFGSNVLASNISSRKQYKYAARLAQLQYDLNQRSLRESPENQRFGLTNAGYNAMLPYMSGTMTNAPSVGLASAAGAPVGDIDTSLTDVTNAMLNIAQSRKLSAETKNIGNDKNNFIINGLKGLFGLNNDSGAAVSYELGKLAKDTTLNVITSIKNKLSHFGRIDSPSASLTNSSGVLQGYISNYDLSSAHGVKSLDSIKFTPYEERILQEAISKARRVRTKPPKTFPY